MREVPKLIVGTPQPRREKDVVVRRDIDPAERGRPLAEREHVAQRRPAAQSVQRAVGVADVRKSARDPRRPDLRERRRQLGIAHQFVAARPGGECSPLRQLAHELHRHERRASRDRRSRCAQVGLQPRELVEQARLVGFVEPAQLHREASRLSDELFDRPASSRNSLRAIVSESHQKHDREPCGGRQSQHVAYEAQRLGVLVCVVEPDRERSLERETPEHAGENRKAGFPRRGRTLATLAAGQEPLKWPNLGIDERRELARNSVVAQVFVQPIAGVAATKPVRLEPEQQHASQRIATRSPRRVTRSERRAHTELVRAA